jgi:hypothetical protein
VLYNLAMPLSILRRLDAPGNPPVVPVVAAGFLIPRGGELLKWRQETLRTT